MNRSKFSQAAAVALTVLLAACSGDSYESLLASAKASLAESDTKTAIIELKSALQQSPEGGEARYLLGKAMLASGDPISASLELRKALDLGFDEDKVIPELARSMNLEGKAQELTEQFGDTDLADKLAQADLKTTLALSYGALGRRDQASRANAAALEAVPDYGPARVFAARLKADTGDLQGALAEIEQQIQRTPQDASAWQLKGDLIWFGQHDGKAALAAYRQAIEAKPNFVPAHSNALSILLASQDLEGARAQLEQLRKVLPNHPETLYYMANVALLANETDKALESAQLLLRIAPDNARALQLIGAIEYQRNSFVKAESYLAKAVLQAPTQAVSRRLLALTYVRLGQPAKALSILDALLQQAKPDSAAYSIAAQAHMQAGDLDEAEQALEKLSALKPDDERTQTALAATRIMRGDREAGIDTLRDIASSSDELTADLPLIAALVRERDYPGALKAIDALEKKSPGKPTAANLRGRVLLAQGDRTGARKAFEDALKLQPSFFPAASALAGLAMQDKDVDAAKAYLDGVLKADPKNIQALLASASLKARTGAPAEEIIGTFTSVIQQRPTEVAPRLALVNYRLASKDFKAALEAAQEADSAIPNNPDIVEVLGRAQAAAGDENQAMASFNKLAQLLPKSPLPYLRLADVQWANKDRPAAIDSLKRALSVSPDSLQAQRGLVDAYMAEKRPDDAVAVARDIQRQRPTQPVGYLVEGGIAGAGRQWERALQVYEAGLKSAPDSTDLATRKHAVLRALKRDDDAKRLAEQWVKEHPKDAGFRFFLGDLALTRQDYADAESKYRSVLEIQPANPLALNNVAWLMARAGKPGSVAMALKANEALPDRPVIMDTLAQAYAAEGKPAKAVEVLKQAVAIDPKNPALRLNLARIMIAAGDKAGAKTELTTLAELGDKFPQQAEVAKLLKSL